MMLLIVFGDIDANTRHFRMYMCETLTGAVVLDRFHLPASLSTNKVPYVVNLP